MKIAEKIRRFVPCSLLNGTHVLVVYPIQFLDQDSGKLSNRRFPHPYI